MRDWPRPICAGGLDCDYRRCPGVRTDSSPEVRGITVQFALRSLLLDYVSSHYPRRPAGFHTGVHRSARPNIGTRAFSKARQTAPAEVLAHAQQEAFGEKEVAEGTPFSFRLPNLKYGTTDLVDHRPPIPPVYSFRTLLTFASGSASSSELVAPAHAHISRLEHHPVALAHWHARRCRSGRRELPRGTLRAFGATYTRRAAAADRLRERRNFARRLRDSSPRYKSDRL